MAITITTNHGQYTAPTLAEIIAREYGDHARAWLLSDDTNNPGLGLVVESNIGGHRVLARITRIEGKEDGAAEG